MTEGGAEEEIKFERQQQGMLMISSILDESPALINAESAFTVSLFIVHLDHNCFSILSSISDILISKCSAHSGHYDYGIWCLLLLNILCFFFLYNIFHISVIGLRTLQILENLCVLIAQFVVFSYCSARFSF